MYNNDMQFIYCLSTYLLSNYKSLKLQKSL